MSHISRVLHSLTSIKDKIRADDVARDSLIMAALVGLAGAFNYLYQLCMGRWLSAEDFATLFSLTSIFAIVAVFARSFQTSVAKFASKFKGEEELGKVNYLWRLSLRQTLLLGLASFVVVTITTPLLSGFLNLDSHWHPIILFSSLLFAFAIPANWGILQGLQKFVSLGVSTALLDLVKLVAAIILVAFLGFGVNGGLLSFLLSHIIVFVVTIILTQKVVGTHCDRSEVRGLYSYTGATIIAITCFAILTNADVLLAKHFLPSETTGDYSAIALMGRIVLYASLGISAAMFPKTSELFETKGSHHKVLIKAMLLTLLLSGAIAAVYWLFARPLVDLVFPGKYPLAPEYLPKYGLSMLLFALCFVAVNYFLSLNRTGIGYFLIATALLQTGLITMYHSNIAQVVNIMLATAVVCAVLLALFQLTARTSAQQCSANPLDTSTHSTHKEAE